MAACTVQGMVRVRSGLAPAWPLFSGRRWHRGSAVNGGRRSFPEETRSAIDGGGVQPHTERAIPGSEPGQAYCIFARCVIMGRVVTVKPGCRGVPGAGFIEAMVCAAQAAGWLKTRGASPQMAASLSAPSHNLVTKPGATLVVYTGFRTPPTRLVIGGDAHANAWETATESGADCAGD